MNDKGQSTWGLFLGLSHRAYKSIQRIAAVGLLACIILGVGSFAAGEENLFEARLFSIAVLGGLVMICTIFLSGLCMGLGKMLADRKNRMQHEEE